MINPGLLRIDKPEGITSAHLLDQFKADLKKCLNVKKSDLPKIGHAGTLDPFATGLLLVFLGEAVRLSEYFLKGEKVYEGTIRLGVETDTGDLTGKILSEMPVPAYELFELQQAASRFLSEPYFQIPPMYSAIKKAGRPLYEYARAGIEIERESVLRKIHEFQILEQQRNEVRFCARVSSGTYIRVLAQDWAKNLGTVGVLKSLRRLESSQWSLDCARPWAECRQEMMSGKPDVNLWPEFIPFDQILKAQGSISVMPEEAQMIFKGDLRVLAQPRFVALRSQMTMDHQDWSPIYLDEKLVAVLHCVDRKLKFGKVFPTRF